MSKQAIAVGITAIVVVAAWAAGRAQTQIAEFWVTIETTADGAKLVCLKGCAWTKLSFNCKGKQQCSAEVDARGVGPVSR
jgi:hypothetical protein